MFKPKKSQSELDVDARFLLANERTLLAWIRTGLTLIAGGVAVAFISTDTISGTIAGIGAIGFGGMLSILGFVRYKNADSAIRRGELPSTGVGGMIVVAGVIAFAMALVIVRSYTI